MMGWNTYRKSIENGGKSHCLNSLNYFSKNNIDHTPIRYLLYDTKYVQVGTGLDVYL